MGPHAGDLNLTHPLPRCSAIIQILVTVKAIQKVRPGDFPLFNKAQQPHCSLFRADPVDRPLAYIMQGNRICICRYRRRKGWISSD